MMRSNAVTLFGISLKQFQTSSVGPESKFEPCNLGLPLCNMPETFGCYPNGKNRR